VRTSLACVSTDLSSLVPLVRWTARPSGGPALLPVRKGGFHTRHDGTKLRARRVSWQIWPAADIRPPTARHGPVTLALPSTAPPLPRPAPVRRGSEPSPEAAY